MQRDEVEARMAKAVDEGGGEGVGEASTAAEGKGEVASEKEFVAMDDYWFCSMCTMLNSPSAVACSVCYSPRQVKGGQAVAEATDSAAEGEASPAIGATASGGDTAAAAGTGWWCTVCTLINPLGQRR